MAATPLVRVNIAESLRTRPDEASLTVGTQAKAATAKAAVAANKIKTEKLLRHIRSAGIREKDIQTQGLQLQPDYRYDRQPDGGGQQQRLVGYIANNSRADQNPRCRFADVVARRADRGRRRHRLRPQFQHRRSGAAAPRSAGSGDGARHRRSERICAQQWLYAVRLLSVEEGTSYRGSDIIVTGGRIAQMNAPPPPPPPVAERGGGTGIVAPGQIETAVTPQPALSDGALGRFQRLRARRAEA